MRVFRPTYKDRSGRTKTASKWYVEFTDAREQVRRLPAFTDKKASEEFGRKELRDNNLPDWYCTNVIG